jgi:excisionase family DNA binding protein
LGNGGGADDRGGGAWNGRRSLMGGLMSEVMTIAAAAARLKVKPDTVRDWLKADKLKGWRSGRRWPVDAEDLERILRESPAPGRTEADQYEKFIRGLIEMVGRSGREIHGLGHGRRNEFMGASRQLHQIDVSFIDASFAMPPLSSSSASASADGLASLRSKLCVPRARTSS